MPVAILGQMFAHSKGVKQIETDYFNPFERLLFARNAKEEVDPELARIVLALSKEGKVPSWAIAILDINLFRAAAR